MLDIRKAYYYPDGFATTFSEALEFLPLSLNTMSTQVRIVDITDSRSLSRYERRMSENESSEIVFAPHENSDAKGRVGLKARGPGWASTGSGQEKSKPWPDPRV